jgi:peptide/nickel transport system substrate-binding protein
MNISRRLVLAGAGAASLPRFAIAQSTSAGDNRPVITIAVAKISNPPTLPNVGWARSRRR